MISILHSVQLSAPAFVTCLFHLQEQQISLLFMGGELRIEEFAKTDEIILLMKEWTH